MQRVTPFLWFDGTAADAIDLYRNVFSDSDVVEAAASGGGPGERGGFVMGSVTVGGIEIICFDGGPFVPFNPAISLFVTCETQEEVDRYWYGLSAGGEEGQCGWLVDPYGVSWQIVPSALGRLMGDPDQERAGRVREAMLKMNRLIIAELQAAYDGG